VTIHPANDKLRVWGALIGVRHSAARHFAPGPSHINDRSEPSRPTLTLSASIKDLNPDL